MVGVPVPYRVPAAMYALAANPGHALAVFAIVVVILVLGSSSVEEATPAAAPSPPEPVIAVHAAKSPPTTLPQSLQLQRFDTDAGGCLNVNEFIHGCEAICSRLHCGEVDCQVRGCPRVRRACPWC